MILVDALQPRATSQLGPRAWCHMVSDTSVTELHEFAARIGLKRAWFQEDHYDLVATKRLLALQLGAQPVASRVLAARMVGRRGDRMRQLEDAERDV